MTESDVRAHVGEIARDLVALEVNTILKANITGAKMPEARHALQDIGREYHQLLCEVMGRRPDGLDEERLGSYYAFDRIRFLAKQQLLSSPVGGTASTWGLLQRVKDMSDHLKGVLEQAREAGVVGWDNNYSRAEIQGRPNQFTHVIWLTLPPPDARATMRTVYVSGARARIFIDQVAGPRVDYVLLAAEGEAKPLATAVATAEGPSEFALIGTGEDSGLPGLALTPGRYEVRAGEGESAFTLVVEAFTPPPPLRLAADSMRVVRKAWELGIEEIAMQSVITLDGDVVTRIQPSRLNEPTLRETHQRGVDVAVDFWQDLIGIATGVLESLLSTALRRG